MSADALAAKFQVLEELGSGSFGVVYKAIERESGTVVAIKQIDLESSEDDIQEIQQEISVLSTCASPFVTQYYGSFVKGYKLWIIMEYLAGGSCLDLLKPGPFGEAHIAILMRELLLGLDYLHREGKIHRDIKAANVLLSGTGHVKLADFGVAAQLSSLKSQRNTFVGTPFWMAPEVISQTHGYGFKADIWSLGITAMELAQGEPPNAAIHPMKVLFLIPKEPAPRLEGCRWSKEFKDFVERCLNKDPQRRASAKELLKHKFIRNAGRVQLLQDLIGRRRKWESSHGGRQSHPKLYQETMNTLSMGGEEDWDFDTIRTNPHATLRSQYRGTARNTRSSSGSSSGSGTAFIGSNSPALQDLALNSAPHQDAPSTRGRNASRKPSRVATARRRRSSSPHDQFALEQQQTVYDRVTKESQVLVPETDFGRTGSTVRPFRRVSEREPRPSLIASPYPKNQDPNPSSSSSLPPPPPPPLGENRPPMIVPTTEEGFLGRQLYSTVIQHALSSTASQSTSTTSSSCPHTPAAHDAFSQLAGAWSHLDAIDPEAGLHLVRALLDRLQQNPQLHIMISPPPPLTKPNALVACSPGSKPLTKHRRGGSAVSAKARRKGADDGVLGLGEEARASAQIADVLYGRWVEGLRGRWGIVDK